MKRRQFIERLSLLTGLGLTVSGIPVRSFANPLPAMNDDRILVFIQLAGGNDGLNTLIPFEDGLYYKNRPTLAIPKNEVFTISPSLGFHPMMEGFANLYGEGKMSIIQNVGYENPDRSHFKSMDIWNSASDSEVVKENGWAARYLSKLDQSADEGRMFPMAVELGWAGSLLLEEHTHSHGLFMNTLEEYLAITRQYAAPANSASLTVADLEYDYINYVAVQSNKYASRIGEVAQTGKNLVEYPNSFLGSQLSIVARLISGGLETNVYNAKLKGFDTHFLQAEPHTGLLKQLSEAVAAFQKDIEALQLSKRVTILVYSEFGRRLKEGSFGTDHGTAAPIFVIGESVRGGIIGNNPNLSDLDENGDLKYKFDYRQIYSTILQDHLNVQGTEASSILGGQYPTLPIYQNSIEPYSYSLFDIDTVFPNPTTGNFNVEFYLTELGHVTLNVYSSNGQRVGTYINQTFFSGKHIVPVDATRMAPGHYQLVLTVNGLHKSKSIVRI